jgi:hypothetical protein
MRESSAPGLAAVPGQDRQALSARVGGRLEG